MSYCECVRRAGKSRSRTGRRKGFLGELFRTVSRFTPPAKGLPSPFNWGTEHGIESLFAARARVVGCTRKHFVFRYESAKHFVDVLRSYYGPTHQAFKALDQQKQQALQAELEALVAASSLSSRALCVPGEYLEVVLERQP
jgi:hypothetical protein